MLNWVMGGSLSQGLYTVELYGGLFMFMMYIIFDTQIIVEDAFRGQRDFVKHAMDLLVGKSWSDLFSYVIFIIQACA